MNKFISFSKKTVIIKDYHGAATQEILKPAELGVELVESDLWNGGGRSVRTGTKGTRIDRTGAGTKTDGAWSGISGARTGETVRAEVGERKLTQPEPALERTGAGNGNKKRGKRN